MDTEAPRLSPLRLLDSLGSARAPLVIDVRRRQAFDADPRLIAGATWRDPFDLDAWVRYLPRHRAVVVYCVHGHEISRNAGAALRAGDIEAHVLEGGFEAWQAAGGPTVKARSDPAIPSLPGAPSTWVTRERPKIDRIACPWLVRRFIDPLAQFDYVPEAAVLARAQATGAIAYDIPGVAFTHRGERCSFDALVEDFGLSHPALDRLATIVRGADTGRPDLAPESAGLLAMSMGLGRLIPGDNELLERAMLLYDALYASCRGAVAGERDAHTWNYPS
jgi:rhodanese-related sulfurtransferase